jgi:hypothetical protein
VDARKLFDCCLNAFLEIVGDRDRDTVIRFRVDPATDLKREVTASVNDGEERDAIGEV